MTEHLENLDLGHPVVQPHTQGAVPLHRRGVNDDIGEPPSRQGQGVDQLFVGRPKALV